MNKMLVAVFDAEPAAFEGLSALRDLHRDGDITLYASAVMVKDKTGKINVKQEANDGPVGTAVGLLTGGLIGILGGPAGLAVGASLGGLTGFLFDLDQSGIGATFLDDVSKALTPGKAAVVAEVEESWTTPVDTRVHKLGGTVFRRLRSEVVEDQLVRESAAFEADLNALEDDLKRGVAENRAARLSRNVRSGTSNLLSKRTFIPASAILRDLRDQAPTSPVTLQWLMENLHQQSFGMIMLILGIAAAAPGISLLAGILLLLASFQMMRGHSKLAFPNWVATRELPKRPVDAVVRRAIPILACVETAIYPRLATPPEATKRLVGLAIFILTVRLLLAPFPLSNILPAVLIAFISLAYLEQDGLLLIVGLVAGCLLLILDLGVIWQLTQGAKWLTGLV